MRLLAVAAASTLMAFRDGVAAVPTPRSSSASGSTARTPCSAAQSPSLEALHVHLAPELRPLLTGPFGPVNRIANRGQHWYRCTPLAGGLPAPTPIWQRGGAGAAALAYSCADRRSGQVLVPSGCFYGLQCLLIFIVIIVIVRYYYYIL